MIVRPSHQKDFPMRRTLLCIPFVLLATIAHGADQPPAETADEFAASALTPFWKAKRLRESMFFIQSEAGARPQSSLLFKPTKILSVTSATRETTYEAGRDYVFDESTATLRLPEGSRIPFKPLDDLHPLMTSDTPKIGRMSGDKSRGVFFDNADGYHKLQIEVTYDCEPGQWKGGLTTFAGEELPGAMKKLRARSRSSSCSAATAFPPVSTRANTRKQNQAAQPMANSSARAGETIRQQGDVRKPRGQRLGHRTGPEAGDGEAHWPGEAGPRHHRVRHERFFGRDAAGYQKNIRGIMEAIRKDSPDTEFILVAPMLGNAEWGMPMEQFPLYRDALKQLCERAAACARRHHYDLGGPAQAQELLRSHGQRRESSERFRAPDLRAGGRGCSWKHLRQAVTRKLQVRTPGVGACRNLDDSEPAHAAAPGATRSFLSFTGIGWRS